MPSKRYHLKFDEVLKSKGVIYEDTQSGSVHSRLDRRAQELGIDHRELDYWHSVKGIRQFIDNMDNSIGICQETATDYVRIAHGHICLDTIASKMKREYNCEYCDLDWDEVYRRTWRYYKDHGFDKSYYMG